MGYRKFTHYPTKKIAKNVAKHLKKDIEIGSSRKIRVKTRIVPETKKIWGERVKGYRVDVMKLKGKK